MMMVMVMVMMVRRRRRRRFPQLRRFLPDDDHLGVAVVVRVRSVRILSTTIISSYLSYFISARRAPSSPSSVSSVSSSSSSSSPRRGGLFRVRERRLIRFGRRRFRGRHVRCFLSPKLFLFFFFLNRWGKSLAKTLNLYCAKFGFFKFPPLQLLPTRARSRLLDFDAHR